MAMIPVTVAVGNARDGPAGYDAGVQRGNRYMLVVDRASRFVFAYPLESKDSVGVARKLLELLLPFGVPLPIKSDAWGEFTAKVVAHLCQWLRVQLDHGPADHPRSQWGVERMAGGSRRYWRSSVSLGRRGGTST